MNDTPIPTNVSRALDKVFVVNYNDASDFSSAATYGELVYMTSGYTPLHDIEELDRKISTYINLSSATDYLVLSGASVLSALAVLRWKEKHGYVNLLMYNRKARKHLVYVIK